MAVEPLAPRVAPALPHDGRVGRLADVGRHAGRPVEHVGGEHAAAEVVHVVGVAVVGGVDRRRSPRSAGGLRAAACSAANPPHETPIMPTAPVHHGCAASQPITASTSSCSCDGVLVVDQPVGVAAAAQVEPHAGVAVAGEVGVLGGVARGRAVALAVGHGLEDRGHGIGRRPRAARGGRRGGSRRAPRSTGARRCASGAGTRTGSASAERRRRARARRAESTQLRARSSGRSDRRRARARRCRRSRRAARGSRRRCRRLRTRRARRPRAITLANHWCRRA